MAASSDPLQSLGNAQFADINVESDNLDPITKRDTKKDDEDDDDDVDDDIKCKKAAPSKSFPKIHVNTPFEPPDTRTRTRTRTICAFAFPHIAQIATRFALGAVVTLYILNQQHMLPKPLSAVVSKTLFWPTLPITFSKRIGKWSNTIIDDTVVLGGAPFGWLHLPERLYEDYGVRAVINLCEEYQGPVKQYKRLGMRELRLPTTDHFEPSVEDMKTAVEFIKEYQDNDLGKVYVHCRAGHGRSAAIVYAWLLAKEDDVDSIDMETLNAQLCELRDVRKLLFKQPNVNEFRSWLRLTKRRDGGKDEL